MMRHTFKDRLVLTHGRPSGFDYMRILLAVSVVMWHSGLICGYDTTTTAYKLVSPFANMIVPMFFTLSGFLVAGSLERSKTLVNFLGLRVLRIMPALSVEVLLSALILGPLLTTLSLQDYAASPVFWSYFANILGEIHYYLPGVFETHPNTQVNGQLWTVPYELICYILLSGLAVLGLFHKRKWLFYFIVLCYAAQIANTIYRGHSDLTGPTGSTVVMSFVAGLLIYRYQDRLSHSPILFWAMLIISYMILNVPNGSRFVILPLAYVTCYLGLMNPKRSKVLLSGDYSYGVYLFGFPLQQMFYAIDPLFRTWIPNTAASLMVAVAMAVISWWLIEKPALSQRGKLKKLEEWYLSMSAVQWLRSRILPFQGKASTKSLLESQRV